MINNHQEELIWVPGNQGIQGKEKPEECDVIPLVAEAYKIDNWLLEKIVIRLSIIDSCLNVE